MEILERGAENPGSGRSTSGPTPRRADRDRLSASLALDASSRNAVRPTPTEPPDRDRAGASAWRQAVNRRGEGARRGHPGGRDRRSSSGSDRAWASGSQPGNRGGFGLGLAVVRPSAGADQGRVDRFQHGGQGSGIELFLPGVGGPRMVPAVGTRPCAASPRRVLTGRPPAVTWPLIPSSTHSRPNSNCSPKPGSCASVILRARCWYLLLATTERIYGAMVARH